MSEFNRMDFPPDTRIYGWSLDEIRKVQNWLKAQNATLADLDHASIDLNRWPRLKIQDAMREDFK